MVKRGKKRQILTQLYKNGYDPKTAQDYLKTPEAKAKYGDIKISRGFYYNVYKEVKQGTVTSDTRVGESKSPEAVKTSLGEKTPLKISVTGEPTPPEQLKIIQAGEGIQPQQQMLTGEQMSGFWQSIAYNYPEKHRWDDGANKFLGAVWAPVFNKWVSASSENFLLGFAVICTVIVVLKPTIMSIRDWQASKKSKESGTPLQKRVKRSEKEALKTNS